MITGLPLSNIMIIFVISDISRSSDASNWELYFFCEYLYVFT
jgi:hypothetical protein